MSLPLLLIAAVAGFSGVLLAFRWSRPKTCCRSATPPGTVAEWQVSVVASLRDAEEMLDRLENCGVVERELETLGHNRFAVRWR